MLRSEGFRKYLRNTSWLFIERVVRLAVVLLTGVLVARYLGAELFGRLNYATGFVGLFYALSIMGVDEIVVRDLVRHPERHRELLGSSMVVKFLGSIVLLILVVISTFIKDMDALTASLVIVLAVAEPLQVLNVVEYHFQAELKARKSTAVLMTQVFITAGMKVALIAMKAPIMWFAWVYVMEHVIMSLGYVISYRSEGRSVFDWVPTRKMAYYLLRQSWPLVVYGLALFVQTRIDQVMIFDLLKRTIGVDRAYAEVGQYSVALKMIEALGFIPVIIQKSLAPAITRARAQDRRLYVDRLVNQYRLMFSLFLAIGIPVFLLAEPVMVLLYGAEFKPAGFLLSLFAIRLLFVNMGVARTSFITNESLFWYSLVSSVAGAITNICMNYFLIPSFQSIGAIWATIGSFVVSNFLLDLAFRSTRANFSWMMTGMTTFWRFHRAN